AAPAPNQTQRSPARCPMRERYVTRMPTMSAASRVSRHAMSTVWIMVSSLDDQDALPLGMEVVEELVAAGGKPGEIDGARLPRLDRPTAVQLEALELDGGTGVVADFEPDLRAARRLHPRRLEAPVPHGERHGDLVRAARRAEEHGQHERHRELKT